MRSYVPPGTRSLFVLLLALAACGTENEKGTLPETGPDPSEAHASSGLGAPLTYPLLDDQVRHDTLLIQVTFDLGDGTQVMVASHVDEKFEGLRLYRYRVMPDSQALVLKASGPAYDSWTMLPTFFRHPYDSTAWIVLADLGERQSWGQKVFRLDAGGFTELGFLDVALPVNLPEEDGGAKLTGIGPVTRVMKDGDDILFRFQVPVIHLYDDLVGGIDLRMGGDRITYRWNPTLGMVLHVDGKPHRPK